jgi:hypothetical protein
MPGYYVPPWLANNPVETMERQRQALHDEGLQDAALGQRAAEAEANRRQQAWEMQRREQMAANALAVHQQTAAQAQKLRGGYELATLALRKKAEENAAARANRPVYRSVAGEGGGVFSIDPASGTSKMLIPAGKPVEKKLYRNTDEGFVEVDPTSGTTKVLIPKSTSSEELETKTVEGKTFQKRDGKWYHIPEAHEPTDLIIETIPAVEGKPAIPEQPASSGWFGFGAHPAIPAVPAVPARNAQKRTWHQPVNLGQTAPAAPATVSASAPPSAGTNAPAGPVIDMNNRPSHGERQEYKTADDVGNAVDSGELTQDEAAEILRTQFGYK